MPAKIYKIGERVRRRKRTVFTESLPPLWRKRQKIIQVRVADEVKSNLQWLSAMRGEPLGTMMGLYASMLGSISEKLRNELNKKTPDLGMDGFSIATTIDIGDNIRLEKGYHPVARDIRTSARYKIPDAFQQSYMEIYTRLNKLYEWANIDEIMQREDPELGCSIARALQEKRFKKVKRLIKNREREAKEAQRRA